MSNHEEEKKPVYKKWYFCPFCNKNIVKYSKDAECKGVFLLCKKCGKQVEIKINKNKSLN